MMSRRTKPVRPDHEEKESNARMDIPQSLAAVLSDILRTGRGKDVSPEELLDMSDEDVLALLNGQTPPNRDGKPDDPETTKDQPLRPPGGLPGETARALARAFGNEELRPRTSVSETASGAMRFSHMARSRR